MQIKAIQQRIHSRLLVSGRIRRHETVSDVSRQPGPKALKLKYKTYSSYQPRVLWGSSRLYTVCCKPSRVMLSVCWPVQLSSLQLSQTVNPQPAPHCLVIAVTKSSISIVIGADMTDTPECLLAGLPFNAASTCCVWSPNLLPAKSIPSHLCCEICCVHLYLWALWVAMKRERENICFCCVWSTCCVCVLYGGSSVICLLIHSFNWIERVSSLAMFTCTHKNRVVT